MTWLEAHQAEYCDSWTKFVEAAEPLFELTHYSPESRMLILAPAQVSARFSIYGN